MPGRRGITRSGAKGISWRRAGPCAAVALVLAGVAFADSVASVAWHGNPALALRIWPGDARALARRGELIMLDTANGAHADTVLAGNLARRALSGAPLQARALRVAGFAAEARDDAAGAKADMRLADRVSRRDVLTQLWKLEDAVGRGDTAGTLGQYDIVLRIKPDTQQLLFPILARAIAEPAVRTAFLPYYRASTNWAGAFVDYAATRGSNPAALAGFLVATGRRGPFPTTDQSSQLLTRLLSSGDFAAADRFGRWLPSYTPGLQRNLSLGRATTAAALRPLTWMPGDQPGVRAQPGDRGKQMHIYADAGATGQVLQRFAALAPGRYALAIGRRIASAGEGATETWAISCFRGGQFAPQWTSAGTRIANRTADRYDVTLPGDCPHQYITVSINGGGDETPLEYDLTSIAVASVP